MRLSILLELLLVFIIIAFGAAKPLSRNEHRVTIETDQNHVLRQQEAISRKNETTEYDDYDDDEDDIFGLGITNDVKDKNKDDQQKPTNETEEDEDALDDDDDDDDKDSEEDGDDGEFLLFGEDLFGLFDDGNKTKKKKVVNKFNSSTNLPLNVVSTTLPSIKKITVNEQTDEADIVSIGTVQDVVNQLTPVSDTNKGTPQLHLQHTTALLELAQSSGIQEDSTTMNGIQNIYDMHEVQNESEFENNLQMDVDKNASGQSGEKISLTDYNTVSNVVTVTSLPIKKQTQKQDNSFFGLVESFISDDDEDQKIEDENDTGEIFGEDEDETDNDEETLIEESEEQNAIKNKKEKKKTTGVIGSISESFSLLG